MFGKWGEISWKRESRLTMDGRWLGRRSERKTHQTDPTNPTGTIRHDRQSVVWLVEPAWKAIVTLLWVAPDDRLSLSLSPSRSICLSLSLSLGRSSPIAKQRARRRERAKEKTNGERGKIRGETGTLIITLAFMYASQGGSRSLSFFF